MNSTTRAILFFWVSAVFFCGSANSYTSTPATTGYAECVEFSTRTNDCTKWKPSYEDRRPHWYLSWTNEKMSYALDQCEEMPAGSVAFGVQCSTLFSVKALCSGKNLGTRSSAMCGKWGLLNLPPWVNVALSNIEGLSKCQSIMGNLAGGIANIKHAPLPEMRLAKIPASEQQIEHISNELSRITTTKQWEEFSEEYESYKNSRSAIKYFEDYYSKIKSLREINDKLRSVDVSEVSIIFGTGTIKRQLTCLDKLIKGLNGEKGGDRNACNLQPGDIDKLMKIIGYIDQTDAVQCFKAAGLVAREIQKK